MEIEKKYHAEVNCITGETTTREFTSDEYAEAEALVAQQAEKYLLEQEELVAKEAAKANGIAKLMALGLTEEEAQALTK